MENEFSEFVRNMRAAAGLSSKKLAEQLGCSRGTICKYESGACLPKEPEDFEKRLREVVKREIKRKRELEYAEAY